MKHLALIFFFLLVSFSVLYSQQGSALISEPVKLYEFVTDQTGTLSRDEINSLNQKLIDFEKTTSNQLVVYMISTLEDIPIEEVSMRIAEKNLIGQKGKDNGVLLLIAKDDRQLRIEVGYGLEGALTDALSSSIIRNEITPEFRNGNFYEGIDKGVDAIILATKGEYIADETPAVEFDIPSFIAVVLIFGFFLVMFITGIVKTIKGTGTTYTSGRSGSGYSGGFWSSGGSSSSGSSFGSFSGGGGSFGGGGASGGW